MVIYGLVSQTTPDQRRHPNRDRLDTGTSYISCLHQAVSLLQGGSRVAGYDGLQGPSSKPVQSRKAPAFKEVVSHATTTRMIA